MYEEKVATNPKKSAVDERVDKLEATMQTMAATFQTISLALFTLTTDLIPPPTSLIPTIPVPPVLTITPTSYPPFEMNNPTLLTTSPFTLNIPPLIGQVPAIQPNLSIAMLRLALEDGKSREVDHKLQQLEEALKAISGCPYAHLKMYAKKMAPYANDERVLIHYFQDSLSGPASVWFSTLDKKKIHTFKDVSQAFMKQYEYNMSLALTRDSLQKITKKSNETFKEFAQRWRSEAAKVIPPLTDSEICSLFIKSTTRTFYAWLAPCVGYTFAQLVTMGEQIEEGLKASHGTEYCTTLKHKIQDLIDEGKLQLDETKSAPSITWNPLPPHSAPTMNMIALDEVDRPILENVGSWSLHELFAVLIEYDLIQPIASISSNVPLVTIDDALVCFYHSNMKGHALRDCRDFQGKIKELQGMGVLRFTSTQEVEKFITPVTEEYFTKDKPYILQDTTKAQVISQPYVLKTSLSESLMGKTSSVVMPQRSTILNSIANDVSNMTCSGRCYVSLEVEKSRKVALKSKDIRIEEMPEESPKKLVSENEVAEFLNILRKKLMLTSKVHLDALLKVLKEAYVPKNIDTQKFGTVLKVDESHINQCNTVVCAFDGTKRNVVGKIELLVEIGPVTFDVDISPAFNMLRGRPWIHVAGALPTTLHQKAKYIVNGVVVTVNGEEEHVIRKATTILYLGIDLGTYESSYHSMECAFKLGEGLGLNGQGILEPIKVTQTWGTFGLGYKWKKEDWQRMRAIKAEKRLAKLQGRDPSDEPMWVPPIRVTFPPLVEILCLSLNGYMVKHMDVLYVDSKGTIFTDRLLEIEECSKQTKFKVVVVEDITDEAFMEKHPNFHLVHHAKALMGTHEFVLLETVKEESLCDLWGNLTINALDEKELEFDRGISLVNGSSQANWIAELLLVAFISEPANNESLNNDAISDFIYEIDDQTYSEEDNENFDPFPELTQMLREEKPKLQPNQETETINLGTKDDRKEIKINAHLSTEERKELIELLSEFQDVFAWSYKDMPGLDPDIAVHVIPLYSEAKPVKQKLRRMKPEVLLKVKEEVKKLLDVNFIETVMYPGWVANIVPIMKKDGRVRVYVEYRDLNKASPKDDFPLPHIQILLDNAAKNAWFSFVDGYSRYNQIKMEEDKLKTTFITQWGTFCYKLMPFGLKNARPTYQRFVLTLLHDFVHTIVELYVDDMVIMSTEEVLHTENLKKVFEHLRKYQLRLNPAKCTFDVDFGKLLGFIVSRQGIEIDPAKIKVIDEMPPPKTQKEVRGFLGRINYIARFLANLTTICKKERAIYYVSKKFNDCESKYSPLEKTCCALTWTSKKLRHYMLTNTTYLLSRMDLIKFIFEKPTPSRRISRWHILLFEFDIVYTTQKAIKGQAIADHLAEHAAEDYEPIDWDFPDEDILAVEAESDSDNWKLFFDGAVN
ncbi:hypothetical protein SLEP1_g34544 [Rubroshorea leprosula]|uniref:Reverse transcriptase n=1 Tax=Rubroshorea leprosula TaxID=152421 RepID=A0AAV5KKK1_9ROSI|nr:hypothetical protein SLEP1_g34544 [Rubroshorea leprosula]